MSLNDESGKEVNYAVEGNTGDNGEGRTVPAGSAPKSFLRRSGSWTDIFLFAVILSVLLLLMGELITSLLNAFLPVRGLGMRLAGDEDIAEFLLMYFGSCGVWIAFVLVISFFKGNWPMWKAFLYNRHGNNFRAVLIGILLGGGMNGFCILMSYLRGDIKLTYNSFDPGLFFLFLFCVLVQSGAEEIVNRCYLYQKLRRRYRWPAVAVLVNSLIFMALHMGNPGVTRLGLLQVFLIGVLFSLIVYYWDSLWTVIWAHTAWNFSQSIVFGLPNSGIVSKYSVFKLDAASASDGLFYNTGFGVEGSPGANIMIGAAILLVLIIGLAARRGEKKDYWQEMEESAGERKHIWEIVVLAVLAVLAVAVIGLMIYISRNSESIRKRLEEYQAQSSAAVPVRVLILARNEAGDLTDDIHGEAQYFYEAYLEGGQEYDISGDQEGCRLYIKDGAALYITGTGKVNAALNLQALLTDPGFDFSDAYILSAGSALSAAEYGVPGDVYVITAAVDYDRGRANVTQDPDTSAAVTLNTDLADHCYELVKEVKLETTESTRTFMKEGFGNKKWARRRPKVKTGTSVGGESFMRGEEDHSQALLMTQNSGCRDPYAAMGPEDAALAQVLQRADLLDRFVILRAGIETDLYAKGENTDKAASSAKELPGTADIYETAMKNSFYVGRILIDAFLKETEKAAGAQAAAR